MYDVIRECPTPESPLQLTTPGHLELFFIGVGSAFANEHNQLNFLIIKGDHHIMVDFGMTGPRALKETAHLDPTAIDVILPTHSHADHIGGIECLALMNRYVSQPFMNKRKLTMIINEEYQRVLWTHSLQGGLEWNESGKNGCERLQFSDFFSVIRPRWKAHSPREIFDLQFGDIKLEIFRTNHIPEQAKGWEASFISYGMFIDDHVFVSMDTKFDRDLVELYGDRSDVMFHDVQFFPGAVHAPLEELHTLPPQFKGKMLLMHYADNWRDQDITGFAGWTEQGVRYVFH